MKLVNSITSNWISKITVINTFCILHIHLHIMLVDKVCTLGMGKGVGWVVLFKVRCEWGNLCCVCARTVNSMFSGRLWRGGPLAWRSDTSVYSQLTSIQRK